MSTWWNWQTRHFEGVVLRGVQVQVLSWTQNKDCLNRLSLPEWRNWQTRTFQVRISKGVQVQVLFRAQIIFLVVLSINSTFIGGLLYGRRTYSHIDFDKKYIKRFVYLKTIVYFCGKYWNKQKFVYTCVVARLVRKSAQESLNIIEKTFKATD